VPREARERDRDVLDAGSLRLDQVGRHLLAIEAIHSFVVSKTAYGPWTDHIERAIHVGPRRLRPGVARQRAPAGRNAAEQRDAIARIRVVPEEVDQFSRRLRRRRAVGEAEAPDRQQRPAVVTEVARALRDAQRVDDIDPVALHILDQRLGTMAGDVVHQREDAAVRLGGGPHVPGDRVAKRPHLVAIEAGSEALQEHAWKLVLLQPAEMRVHDGIAVSRVQLGGAAVGHRQIRHATIACGEL